MAHPGLGLWFSFPCTAHFTAQLLPVVGREAALWEARGWHFQARGRAGFAMLHPHPTDSREEAKLVKQVGWSLMQDTPQPTPALAHDRGSSVFPPSSKSKALCCDGISAGMEPGSLFAPSCAHSVQELAVKEAREQSGSCSNLVTHGDVSGSDFLSPDGNIWIKDLGGAPWL